MKTPHRRPTTSQGAGPVGCRHCDLNEICRLTGLLAFDAGRSRQSTGQLRAVPAGTALFRAGERAEKLYAVRQGLLKTARVDQAGEEQILALNMPGEVLGLEAFGTGTYANDVIALQPVVCCELPLRLVAGQGQRVDELGSALLRLLGRSAAPRPHPARGPIPRRVRKFLLDLAARLTSRGLDGRQFALGLSRQEIANLLDTRIETVSRVLQSLHRARAIHVRGGRVRLESLTAD